MEYDFRDAVKLFMIFDVLGDTERTGPITGDITKFEGVSKEEREKVTNLAIDYLAQNFNGVLDLKTILDNYKKRVDIESKLVHMIDKVHSAIAFIKYQTERNVDMDDPNIIPELRNHPFVVKKIAEGKDLADIFYEFHMKAVNITDQECESYKISRQDADQIVNVVRAFAETMYAQKLDGSLLAIKDGFPKEAMIYNRNKAVDYYE